MPPKRVKEIEPTDRATRSKTTDKPAPIYTYPSEEEDSIEEYFDSNIDLASTGNLPRLPAHLLPPVERRSYSPTEFDSPTRAVDKTTHSTLFHSVLENSNMASDHESDNEGQANARLPAPTDIPPIVVPGMDPAMAAMFAMMQQNQAAQLKAMRDDIDRRDRQAERERRELQKQADYNRRKDLEASNAQLQMIMAQMASMNTARPEKPKPSAAKIPPFDIENDQASFPQWLEKWNAYVISNRLHTIPDQAERDERIFCDLTQAFSMQTLKWLKHREMTEEERAKPDEVIKHIEAYIKESTNPVVSVIELVTMKRLENETADHLIARVHEKLAQCDTNHITDMRDYLGMVGIMVACEPSLRKRMFLDKVDTFAKASAAVKADAQATSHSKMTPADQASINATSSYKRDQNSERARPNQGQYQSHSRGQARGHDQSRSHGSHQNGSRDYERGRSQSQNRSDSQVKSCFRCGKSNHEPQDCYFKEKTCLNCDKIGHASPACRNAKRYNTQSQASGSANSVEAYVNAVSANLSSMVASVKAGRVSNTLGTLAQRYPLPEHLDTVTINLSFMQPGSGSFNMQILPDTGANVTAIDASQAKGISLEKTNVVLRVANGTVLNTLGTAECMISRHGNGATELVYVVKGLAEPLLSRRMLKALNMLHPDWPHQNCSRAAANNVATHHERQSNRQSGLHPDHELERQAEVSEQPKLSPIVTGNPVFDNLANEFRDVFSDQCKAMKGEPHHIELKPGATPVNTGASRSVPEPLQEALKKELENLTAQGIIAPISQATEWLHPMVVVHKKGQGGIRICVDFRRLNEHVIRPTNPQPTPWEIVRTLPKGITHFAVFDALKGYHQVELDEESQLKTAFMTPFGRYIYRRLGMGMISAGDVFTLRHGNVVDPVTESRRATEDTLLIASTTHELLVKTRIYFQACQENGITLSLKKVQFDQREVIFGGFLLNSDGYSPDPSLSKALSEFPHPKNITDMRSFFGLANQLCNFKDDIAQIMSPLQPLLKKGTAFQWLEEHEEAFQKAKTHLSSKQTLTYYCPKRKTRLISDASRLHGLGFVLKQEQENGQWKLVQAGSRFITAAEKNYAMCELELLGIVWACSKTKMFVEGLEKDQFEIWTDHAPLVPILEKQTLQEVQNKRLQRLKMKLNHLTFTTKWVKGEHNIEADCLSRNPCAHAGPEDELDEEVAVAAAHMVVLILAESKGDGKCQALQAQSQSQVQAQLNSISSQGAVHIGLYESNGGLGTAPGASRSYSRCTWCSPTIATINSLQPADRSITDERLRELKLFASEDEIYKLIMELTTRGFPDTPKHKQSEELLQYFKVRDEFTIDSDGFLCKGAQFVVPKALVKTYLQRLHSMHQSSGKMMARARNSLWWPFMARDISSHAKSCLPCETNKDSNPAELILTHEPSQYPFQHLHMDIGQEQGYYYLISTCQFSGYPNLHDTGKTCNTDQVIDATATLISLFGIPEVIYTDGGPQFLENGKFDTFCKEWGIRHILSSPYMPRSNGHAEAAVKQMKKLIKGNLTSNGRLDRRSFLAGMQMFRNTPRQPSGQSPNQLIFGRHIRDSLPMPKEHLLPEFRFRTEERLQNHRQNKLPEATRSGPSRELHLLKPRTPVRIQNAVSKKWDRTGFVISFGQNEREYLVRVGHKTIRRNRHFLKEIEVEAVPPMKQPAQPPSLPPTPQGSNFQVDPNWFKKPDTAYSSEEERQENESRNEAWNAARQTKIRFSPIVDTSDNFFPNVVPSTSASSRTPAGPPSTAATTKPPEEGKRSDRFTMPAKRVAPGYSDKVNRNKKEKDDPDQFPKLAERRAPCPPATARSPTPAQRTEPSRPASAWPPMPAQRSSTTGSPDQIKQAPKYRAKMPAKLKLSWPNNVVLKPRRMTMPTPANNSWDNASNPNWRSPAEPTAPRSPPAKAAKPAKTNDRWDKDSKWVPPRMKATNQLAPARSKRSTTKPTNYNDDNYDDDSYMNAAF